MLDEQQEWLVNGLDVAHGRTQGQRKVVHVITDSFSAHSFLRLLVRYLEEHGWHSIIASSPRSYDDAHSFTAELRSQGFDVRDVDIPRHIDLIGDLREVIRVRRLIDDEKPSLVHTHLAKGGIIGRLAARLAGVPCVHTVYDYAFVEHRGMRRRLYREIERAAAVLAQRIMFVSENERQLSLAAGIGRPDQLITVGCGADPTLFDPSRVTDDQLRSIRRRFGLPDGRLVIGAVARLIRRKGIDLLLQSAAILAAGRVDAHVLIVGGGPLQGELANMADRLGLRGCVSFTGFIDNQADMPAIFGAMDVFCLPSRREGYGMVYAEAGSMQKPVVGPAMAPINTIVIDGKTGFLVPPEDPTAIAHVLQRLLANESLRVKMGREAGTFVRERCNFRSCHPYVLKVYGEVLNCSRPGRRTDSATTSDPWLTGAQVGGANDTGSGVASVDAVHVRQPQFGLPDSPQQVRY